MPTFYHSKEHSDLKIITKDGDLLLHRFMIASASDFLKVCLLAADERSAEPSMSVVSLPDHSKQEVDSLLAFIYGLHEELCSEAKSVYHTLFPPNVQIPVPTSPCEFLEVKPSIEVVPDSAKILVKEEEKLANDYDWLDEKDGDWSDEDFDPYNEPRKRKRKSTAPKMKRKRRKRAPKVEDIETDEGLDLFDNLEKLEAKPKVLRRVGSACRPILGPFNCPNCDYESDILPDYMEHLKAHLKTFCTECQRPIQANALKEHCKRHLAECLECEIAFKSKEDAPKHLQEVHFMEPIRSCTYCNIKYGTNTKIELHEMNCVQLTVQEIESKRRGRKEECITKNVPFPTNEEDPNVCPAEGCTYSNTTPSVLKHHYFVKHCRQKCPHCDKVLGVYHLEDHIILAHTKNYQHVCEICSQGFFRKCKLQYHMEEEHIKDPKYVCDLCGEKFFSRPRLNNHRSNKHQSFNCQFCPKTYPLKASLLKHLKSVHNGMGVIDLFKDKHGHVKQVKAVRNSLEPKPKGDVKILGSETYAAQIHHA